MSAEVPPLYAAILGFGTVGQGVYNILQEKRAHIARQLGGRELVVVKVLVSDVRRPDRRLPRQFDAHALLTDRFEEVLAAVPDGERLDVVFEAMVGPEPAHSYLTRLLAENRCRAVVTANKVMYAQCGRALQALAAREKRTTGQFVGLEACVAGGVPVVKTMQNMSKVQSFRKVEGIFNGTSNYMLTRMRTAGLSYAAALSEAQEKGYAEADPYNDVSGQDAFCKVMIAAELAFGRQPAWDSVPVVGIDSIDEAALKTAAAQGLRYRQVGSVELVKSDGDGPEEGTLIASVRPVAVDSHHPLYGVDNADVCVAFHTDYLGCVSSIGSGAGMYPTASVMVEDYLTSVPPIYD